MVRVIQTGDLREVDIRRMSDTVRESVYCGLDAAVTLEVFQQTERMLDNTTRATYEFSKALQGPVMEMQMRGLLVDFERRDQVLRTYKEQIALISAQLDRLTKEGFGTAVSWRSPLQLRHLFYDVLGCKKIYKRGDDGAMVPTVNRDAIERLQQYFEAEPICVRLLALRDLDKKRMFLESSVDPDGRIRTNLNIAGTTTGRLASAMSDFGTGTNLQNVDHLLRSVFVADRGMKFGNLDLEQGDSRNVGAICWNLFVRSRGAAWAGAYLDACESGDLHTQVCKMAWTDLPWGSAPDRKIAEAIAYRAESYRQLAKKLGHGSNYRGQPPTMAKHSHLPVLLAADFQRRYFGAFPCIPAWHIARIAELEREGCITTILGRRRTFFGRHDDEAVQREMIAYEPQSLTADEIDTGIINLFRENFVQLMLQVHDSVLIQYPEEQEAEIIPRALKALEVPIELANGRRFLVPTDAKVGWNWGDEDEDNPDGLQKFKGGDSRKRTERKVLNLREA